jgi:hypothetical protein
MGSLKRMLVMLSGQEDNHFLVFMNMVHNIWEAKVGLHIYDDNLSSSADAPKTCVLHLAWETLEKWTSAISVLRAVTNLVETSDDPYQRYKAHTTPKQ